MRLLLIQPDISQKMQGFVGLVRTEPLALEILAASVPEHEIKILDLRVSGSLSSTLQSFQPDLVGVTGYTTAVTRMQQVCREVKAHDKGIVTVVGGYHATLCPWDFDLDCVDFIVVGEGEITFQELVNTLSRGGDPTKVEGIIYRAEGHQVCTPPRQPARSLNQLPMALRYLADEFRQHYHFHFWDNPYLVETTRGCPYRCTFCAVWRFHQSMCRFRSPEMVAQELKSLGAEIVCFVDDNFLQNVRRAERLYELLREMGLKAKYWIQARSDTIVRHPEIIKKWSEIGLATALIGFESFRDKELAGINKRNSVKTNEKAMEIMRDNGVDIWGAFIVDPQWTRVDFDAMIDYVRSMKIVFPQFTVLTPLPGTQLFQEKLRELTTLNYDIFDLLHSVLPTKLPLEEFYANFARLYASTTLSFGEIKRRIRSGQISVSALGRVGALLKELTNPDTYLASAEPG